MTPAQKRLVETIRAAGDPAEYWPVVNDWVRDSGRIQSLAFRNIVRTVDALVRQGVVRIDDDGYFHIVADEKDRCATCGASIQRMADGRLIRHFDTRDPQRAQWCEGGAR